jgi:hypothetical protein
MRSVSRWSRNLKAVSGQAETLTEAADNSDDAIPASRRGKKAITIWVDPLVANQLKEIAGKPVARYRRVLVERT